MDMAEFDQLANAMDGVRTRNHDGVLSWRYHGRLVARQLDQTHVVVRASFDTREVFLAQFPGTFSVPPRFANHMMVVADLQNGDPDAIEDAIVAAWILQATNV
jgi:hypothetical protein